MKHSCLAYAELLYIVASVSACQFSGASGEAVISPASPEVIQEWQPQSKPDYIIFASDMPVRIQDLCVAVAEYYVWIPGNYGDDVSEAITRTARLLINGYEYRDLVYEIDKSAHLPRLSEDRTQTLGSHNASTSICFDSSTFEPGDYIGTVQFTGTSGVGYSYTWIFKIPEQ